MRPLWPNLGSGHLISRGCRKYRSPKDSKQGETSHLGWMACRNSCIRMLSPTTGSAGPFPCRAARPSGSLAQGRPGHTGGTQGLLLSFCQRGFVSEGLEPVSFQVQEAEEWGQNAVGAGSQAWFDLAHPGLPHPPPLTLNSRKWERAMEVTGDWRAGKF